MSSQELLSSPKSPVRTYSSKKRTENKPAAAAKPKRKANSDDDTRDSVEESAPATKETPRKEEGYGTEPDRESPNKREESPDLALEEPLNSPAGGKKRTLTLKNKQAAFDDDDVAKPSQEKAKVSQDTKEKSKPLSGGSQREEKEKPVKEKGSSQNGEKRAVEEDSEKKEGAKKKAKPGAKKAAAKRKQTDEASEKEKEPAEVKEKKDDTKEEKKEEKKAEEAKEEKKEAAEKKESAKPAAKRSKVEKSLAKGKRAHAEEKKGKKADKEDKSEEKSKKKEKPAKKLDEKLAKRSKAEEKKKEKEEEAKEKDEASEKKSPKKKAPSPKKATFKVAISGGEGAAKADLEAVLKQLHATVVDEVNKNCTAVLLLDKRRTFKVLHALALGVPLVKAEWALASLDGQRQMSEYSAKGWFKGANGKGGLLKELKVYIEKSSTHKDGMPADQFRSLITAAGGELVGFIRDADYVVLSAKSKLDAQGAKPVTYAFFLDALANGALPPPSEYKP